MISLITVVCLLLPELLLSESKANGVCAGGVHASALEGAGEGQNKSWLLAG